MATTHFCGLPANFNGNTYHTSRTPANLVKSVTDRRLDTSSTQSVFVLDLTRNPRVTHVFVKGQGLTSIQVTNGSDVVASQSISAFSVSDAQGREVAFDGDGFQNILLPLTGAPITATMNTLGVTVGGTRVVELAAIDSRVALDAEERFSQFDFSRQWRRQITHEAITGRRKTIPPVNSEPPRYRCELLINYLDNDQTYNDLLNFFYENPNGFAFLPEPTRYPHLTFTSAILENPEQQLRYIDERLKIHRQLYLSVLEA